MDNVVIERLRKSVKYEDVCLKAYAPIATAKKELTK
jgi:hypothetical protein